MPISMNCPGCATAYAFSEQLAGRTARCPKCSHSLTVGRLPTAGDGEPAEDIAERRCVPTSTLPGYKGYYYGR